MIDRTTAQKIKDAANIVEVVGDYVHLIKSGANYKGLCPFHNERTPSFSVNPSRNFCYCFSCHKGGSPVNFIMEKEGVSYREALLHLAKKYGIKVEEREESEQDVKERTEREAMMVANEWAMREMERNLLETPDGRNIGLQYFYGRGVTEEAIRKFHLGYSLDNSKAMVAAARNAAVDLDVLARLGVLGRSDRDGSFYDRFRGRVIFPVFNTSGKVVAFGGRDLKGGNAKYINSPESPVYKKSRELYGIFQAKSAITKFDKCFLVEGYMDVIGMWQSGLENVVASSGTALTEGQIALIHRFTKHVTLIYDGDAAGIKASLRGIDLLLFQDMKVKVLLLPDGHDPDSFARANTPEQFRAYVDEHETDFLRFKIDVLMSQAQDDPGARAEAVRSVVRSIAHINDKISRFVYIQQCSRLFELDEKMIEGEVEKARGEVLREYNRERDLKYISGLEAEKSSGAQGAVIAQAPVSQAPTDAPASASQKSSVSSVSRPSQDSASFLPLERRLCELTVRFGMLDFCEAEVEEEDAGAEERIMLNVAEFIAGELEADGIGMSNPVYAKILDMVLDMRENLENDKGRWNENIEKEIQKKRQEGQEQIAAASLPLNEIQIQERILEDRLRTWREEAWHHYLMMYPGRELASCEDSEVRSTVTELLFEPYELSKIFFRDRTPERDEDKLDLIVPRAILELKDAILGRKLRALMDELRNGGASNEPELLLEKQREIAALLSLRSQLAKDIGERIICSSK